MQHRRSPVRWLFTLGLLAILLGAPLLPAHATAQEQAEAVLRIHQRYFPDALDPQKSSGVEVATFLATNYEGLTRLDEDLNVVPAAAERWEFDATGTVLTFHLRQGLAYSDGTPLTAENFRYAIERTCDPDTAGDYQHILFAVVGCREFAALYTAPPIGTPAPDPDAAHEAARAHVGARALDEQTLEIHLTGPAPYFPAIAGLPVFYPARQELIAQGGEGWSLDPASQIGNGPFQVTRIAPEAVELVANERYWGGRPALDRLEYVYIPDSAAALEAYQAGDLDVAALDAGMLGSVAEDPKLSQELAPVAGAGTGYLSFNLTREPFADKLVREAFAYAFDRETYCEVLRDGACVPALSWIPPGVPGHIASEQYAFDPARARRALAESSYGSPDRVPQITYAYWSEEPAEAAIAEWIVGQYRAILDIEIALQPLDGKTLVAAMSDPTTYPQMVRTGWVQDYPDPQNWLSVYWTCAASFAQDVGYCNPEFDTLIANADQELDPAQRLALYEAAGQLLVDDVPGVFMTHGIFPFLVKPDVVGYTPTPNDAGWPGQTASLLTVNIRR